MPKAAPDLEERFLEPDGWQWDRIERDGYHLRYGCVVPEQPKAVIVCLPGLSEFCEKYFELSRDFLKHGYGFYVLDWRGHGLSSRHLCNALKRHSFGFDQDVSDFDVFLKDHVKADAPLIMLGHSMGGNIGLRYLAQNSNTFDGAVFSAPMLGIQAIRFLPKSIALFLSSILNFTLGQQFTSFHGQHSRKQNETFEGNPLTSDPKRFELMEAWMCHDPKLRIGDVTFGWVYHAIRSCYQAQRVAHTIETPCFFGISGKDSIVDNAATRKTVQAMSHTHIEAFDSALHEPLMERDPIRKQLLDRIFQFIEDTIPSKP